MDCVSVCPTEALYFGYGKPSAFVKKTAQRNYSLSWPEEIAAAFIFLAAYLAVWDVYLLIPMLMSLGIAAVTTFLAVRLWQLYRASDLFFYKFNLKSSGTIKNAGWVFIFFATVWIGVNAHSGWIRYHEYAGARAFHGLQIPDELALARTDLLRWLSESDRQNTGEGKRHLDIARDAGFLTNTDALPKLAWFEYLSGNSEPAVDLFGEAAGQQSGRAKALSLYYRGSILNRLGRFEEALSDLSGAVAERKDLSAAREQKGEALWKLGRKSEAVAEWEAAVSENERLVLANLFLAAALADVADRSVDFDAKAAANTPNDPLFHWMVGMRLENLGMIAKAEEHFARAEEMNPEFRRARN
jgi:tetratricopeptide (TPR) repeat protein